MSLTEKIIKQVEKDRYLIPCKCKICSKPFADIMVGIHHISNDHRNREEKNVIDNLSWNIEEDLKKWEILQELKTKRDEIINKLNDDKAIDQATIPDVVELHRSKADISEIMKALLSDIQKSEQSASTEGEEDEVEDVEEDVDERDFEDSEDEQEESETFGDEEEPIETTETEDEEEEDDDEEEEDSQASKTKGVKKRNLCDLLEREIQKYLDNIKRLTMASQVEQAMKSRDKDKVKLFKFSEQLDYYLGVSKAVKIIKESKQDLEIII